MNRPPLTSSTRRAPWVGALAVLALAACDGIPVVGGPLDSGGGDASLDDIALDVAGDAKTPPDAPPADVPADMAPARCTTNADCAGNPMGTTCNPMTGMCIQGCRSPADCMGNPAGNICDMMSGLCTMRCNGHADCANSMAGNVCNPMSNMCTARCTANNDCVAHPMGTVCNTMTGACVQPCRANSDCAMNMAGPVCDTMTGLCGTACRAQMDCVGTSTPVCAGMRCVERCMSNDDCAGHPDGTTCNTMTGRCVQPCRTNTDCASNPAGEICEPMSGRCGRTCRSHMDCAGMMGTICNPMTMMCVDRCTANADCMGHPGGAVCDTMSGRCVGCVASNDTCMPSQHCDPMSNTCVDGCRVDEGCPRQMLDDGGVGAQLRCNTMTRTCDQCVTDMHCPTGQRCSSGMCVAGCTNDSNCAMGETCCGGACVNRQTNDQNCGMCGNRCTTANGDPGCEMGACTIARCTAPFRSCDMNVANGCETNTNTSLMHCGACGNACPTPRNATPTCTAGACGFTCNDGFADCNMDPSDGCETNTETSVGNCGACGRQCTATNGVAGCAMGACTVASCNTGFANCDMNVANGCETNTNTTVSSCGRCGNMCPDPRNGTASCTAGACGIASCDSGFADCNMMAADGCEVNLRTSVGNCGGCGRACNLPNATAGCAAAGCVIAACNAGFADCDMNPANGCEVNITNSLGNCGRCGNACSAANGTAACTMGACTVASCNAGFANCNMMASDGCEVNTQTDTNNCNTCGNVCRVAGGTNVCTRGVCMVSMCMSGLGNCDGNAANGCETMLATTLAHCGACGNACPTPANGAPSCTGGTCGIASCTAPFANCDMNNANGCETNTNTSTTHCGRCGNACPARPNMATGCTAGACTYTCNAGFADCDGNAANGCETNLTNDTSNCGACRNVCRPAAGGGAVCTNSTCGQTCPAGQTNCSGTCRATATDVSNCGTCGRVCTFTNASATCANSNCAIAACNAGFGNCDNNAANGCETTLTNNIAACGACGRVCAAPTGGSATCTNGTCGQTCPAGTTNCSGTCRNLLTDSANCGACNRACAANQACSNGACIGQGTLRITMTWSLAGDMDLHVRPPCGTEIYYAARSACGGTLDADNTSGTGPENVFWNAAAPTGNFQICAVPFSIRGATNFTIQVVNNGVLARTFSGTRTSSTGNQVCSTSVSSYVGTYTR